VHVIRHDNGHSKIELRSIVMQAASENDRAHMFWQKQPMVSAERYKMLSVIDLQMRKLSAVESLRHRESSGDSRHRLSGGAKLRRVW
jgi:hypothetical protein